MKTTTLTFDCFMHNLRLIILLCCYATSFGQTQDRRAVLEIEGRVDELSVSPRHNIWLTTATGNTYYTLHADSNWHYGNSITKKKDSFDLDRPHLDRISFFNPDTAIMTGYISKDGGRFKKNGFYRTTDGGKSWELRSFDGDEWIYDVFVDSSGNAWMGGSSGDIFYSKDFGQNWKQLRSPYNSSSRMHTIFMVNETTGVSGALHNEIHYTTNNWGNTRKIKTPLDQKKYIEESITSQNRIEKIILWNNLIVVNQSNHIYYTAIDHINWKPFEPDLFDFELDPNAKKLVAITRDLEIISFTDPQSFTKLTEEKLSDYPLDFRVVDRSAFILTNNYDVFRLTQGHIAQSYLYTTDHEIREPNWVVEANDFTWGATGNQLYRKNHGAIGWYREKALDFYVGRLTLLNDSSVILWDGWKNNYLYTLKDQAPKLYFPQDPLQSFLKSPVRSIAFDSGSQGCFHHNSSEIIYESHDTMLTTLGYGKHNQQERKKILPFENQVRTETLDSILAAINKEPSAKPTIRDFQITAKDKVAYLARVDERLKQDRDSFFDRRKVNKAFYYSVPNMLDTLNSSIIAHVLDQHEGGWSTTSNWFNIQITNHANDTINLYSQYYTSNHPWHLPMKLQYQGVTFNCYSLAFSKFVNECLPKEFPDKDVFDNSLLIMEIADYLWNRPSRK